MFDDMLRMLKNIDQIEDEGVDTSYERRKVLPKTIVGGVIVSTVWTDDLCCYETAILDEQSTIPVQRVSTKEEAIQAHAHWVVAVADPKLTHVTKLGYGQYIDDKIVELQRKS